MILFCNEHECGRHYKSTMILWEQFITNLIYFLDVTFINLSKPYFTNKAICLEIPCCNSKLMKSKFLCDIFIRGNLVFQIQILHVQGKLIMYRIIFSFIITFIIYKKKKKKDIQNKENKTLQNKEHVRDRNQQKCTSSKTDKSAK